MMDFSVDAVVWSPGTKQSWQKLTPLTKGSGEQRPSQRSGTCNNVHGTSKGQRTLQFVVLSLSIEPVVKQNGTWKNEKDINQGKW
jgi:hypothetical protein